jgi:hypothetical protein
LAEISAMPVKDALLFAVECAAIENDRPAEKLREESTQILLPDNEDFREWFH